MLLLYENFWFSFNSMLLRFIYVVEYSYSLFHFVGKLRIIYSPVEFY